MAGFLKVLFRNLLEGPSTDPFPLGETFTPERLRGKCVVDPELCMGCGVCKNVCAANAIDISPKKDNDGYAITIWRNSCCLCASCRHYCPTGAMSIVNDWHHAHAQEEKYDCVERQVIDYEPCTHCGTLIRPLPLKIAQKLYAKNDEVDPDKIRHLCPKCRQLEDGKRIEGVKDQLTASSTSDAVTIDNAQETQKTQAASAKQEATGKKAAEVENSTPGGNGNV